MKNTCIKCCANCKYGRKRSSFDFKCYGWRGAPIECLKLQEFQDIVRYQRIDDCCNMYEKARNEK